MHAHQHWKSPIFLTSISSLNFLPLCPPFLCAFPSPIPFLPCQFKRTDDLAALDSKDQRLAPPSWDSKFLPLALVDSQVPLTSRLIWVRTGFVVFSNHLLLLWSFASRISGGQVIPWLVGPSSSDGEAGWPGRHCE